jgi:eukaryotic-like serine/threonine-protein kinase
MQNLVGRTLNGRYRIEEALGRGGMAEVYRAFDVRRNYQVAVKVLREDLAEDWEFVRRFRTEADSLARLAHRNIVRFYSIEQDGRLAFLVIDYIRGDTLQGRIFEAHGPLPTPEALRITQQVAAALEYAHAEGVIHRDVKPGNIMLQADGTALLADFGIAKAADLATMTTAIPGTPAYMSPEQCRGDRLDARSDVYSLGVVLYEMLAGRRPFVGQLAPDAVTGGTQARLLWEQVHAEPPDPRRFNPALAQCLVQVVQRALAKAPADRYPSALALAEALEAACAPPPRVPVVPIPRPAGAPPVSSQPAQGIPPATARPPAPPISSRPPQGVPPTVARPPAPPISSRPPRGAPPAAGQAGASRKTVWALLLVIGTAILVGAGAGALSRDRNGPLAQRQPAATAAAPPTATVLPTATLAGAPAVVVTAEPEPSATAASQTSQPIATPTLPPAPSPTATERALPSVAPLTAAPLPTAMPLPVAAPSSTPAPTANPTPARAASSTPARPPTATAAPRPAAANLPAPELVWPPPNASASGATTFRWTWPGPALGPNQGFEVRIWRDDQPDHYGAAGIVQGATSVDIDVFGAYGVQQGGSGQYKWTVAVVDVSPYQRTGPEAAPRNLQIDVPSGGGGGGGPAEPTSPPP